MCFSTRHSWNAMGKARACVDAKRASETTFWCFDFGQPSFDHPNRGTSRERDLTSWHPHHTERMPFLSAGTYALRFQRMFRIFASPAHRAHDFSMYTLRFQSMFRIKNDDEHKYIYYGENGNGVACPKRRFKSIHLPFAPWQRGRLPEGGGNSPLLRMHQILCAFR